MKVGSEPYFTGLIISAWPICDLNLATQLVTVWRRAETRVFPHDEKEVTFVSSYRVQRSLLRVLFKQCEKPGNCRVVQHAGALDSAEGALEQRVVK